MTIKMTIQGLVNDGSKRPLCYTVWYRKDGEKRVKHVTFSTLEEVKEILVSLLLEEEFENDEF